jgi:hypothetical protein
VSPTEEERGEGKRLKMFCNPISGEYLHNNFSDDGYPEFTCVAVFHARFSDKEKQKFLVTVKCPSSAMDLNFDTFFLTISSQREKLSI